VSSILLTLASPATVSTLHMAVAESSVNVVVVDDVDALADALLGRGKVAGVVVDAMVPDDVLPFIARWLLPDEQRQLVVVRDQASPTPVPWTVVDVAQLPVVVQALVLSSDAIVVEVLATLKPPTPTPARATQMGCVVAVGNGFLILEADDPPTGLAVAFALPGAGRLVATGTFEAVWGKAGQWRLCPHDESVRQALAAFTLHASEGP
jgi:hypothetical protein